MNSGPVLRKRKRQSSPCAEQCSHFIDECDCAASCWIVGHECGESDATTYRDGDCSCYIRFDDLGEAPKPPEELYRSFWYGMRENAERVLEEWRTDDVCIDWLEDFVIGDEEVELAWMLNTHQRRSFVISAAARELNKQHPLFRAMNERYRLKPYIVVCGCDAMSKEQRKVCPCIRCRCRRDKSLAERLYELRKLMPKARNAAREFLRQKKSLDDDFDEFATEMGLLVEDHPDVLDGKDLDGSDLLGHTLEIIALGEVLPEFDSTLRKVDEALPTSKI